MLQQQERKASPCCKSPEQYSTEALGQSCAKKSSQLTWSFFKVHLMFRAVRLTLIIVSLKQSAIVFTHFPFLSARTVSDEGHMVLEGGHISLDAMYR